MPDQFAVAMADATIQSKRNGVRVKKEKVKQENINGKRRTETLVEDDSHWKELETSDVEEEVSNNADYEGHDSPRGNKRRRMNGEGHSAVEGDGYPEPSLLKVKTLPRGTDGLVPNNLFT